ncbi:MAG: class I SAM-dependent methyltransferase [Balneolaceae bacterium]
MPFFLSHRQPELIELMDREDCDAEQLKNTYRQFSIINGLLSNWRRIYKNQLFPLMVDKSRVYTLLDIGFGGGDIPLAISHWAKKDGIKLKITAIETDKRAFDFAQSLPIDSSVSFLNCSSTDLVENNKKFDFVISNHVIHHLNENDLLTILSESKELAHSLVLFNDIERSDLGYILFSIFSRILFWNSFITADGLTSIKRCYTKNELKEIAPEGWNVDRSIPFRLLLTHKAYEN